MTIGFAIIFALILPNSPRNIRGMTQQQQDWLRWNYERDLKQQDHSDEVSAKTGFLLAARDPKTWLMCGILYATYTAAAVNNFFPTVVAGLGFSRTKSYGLTAPPFILCVICMLINGWHSDKVSLYQCMLTTYWLLTIAETRALPPHCPATAGYSNREYHRGLHTQRCRPLLRHDAHARILLLLGHCTAVMDLRQLISTGSEASGFHCLDQLHLQHSEHLDELHVLR